MRLKCRFHIPKDSEKHRLVAFPLPEAERGNDERASHKNRDVGCVGTKTVNESKRSQM